MSKKAVLKLVVDMLMTVGLLLLMSYSLLGEAAHEWVGIAMFALFVLHHGLNMKWTKSLGRGRYTPFRDLQTVLAALVLITMLGSMASGIVLSRYALRLDIRGLSGEARTVHMLCAYWGFALLGMHLGAHWAAMIDAQIEVSVVKSDAIPAAMMGMMGKLTEKKPPRWLLRTLAGALGSYGLYACWRRDFLNYMLLRYHFVFFDWEEGLLPFLLDYIAILSLFVIVGHYLSVGAKRLGRKNPRKEQET